MTLINLDDTDCGHSFDGPISILESARVMNLVSLDTSVGGMVTTEVQNPDSTPLFLMMCTLKLEFRKEIDTDKLGVTGLPPMTITDCRIITDGTKWSKVILMSSGYTMAGVPSSLRRLANKLTAFKCFITKSEVIGDAHGMGRGDRKIIKAAIQQWIASQI